MEVMGALDEGAALDREMLRLVRWVWQSCHAFHSLLSAAATVCDAVAAAVTASDEDRSDKTLDRHSLRLRLASVTAFCVLC